MLRCSARSWASTGRGCLQTPLQQPQLEQEAQGQQQQRVRSGGVHQGPRLQQGQQQRRRQGKRRRRHRRWC